jgi:hypothetical protein
MPPIDQLQGRPIGRVLTKMGKVNREQVVEALDFQKRKGGALRSNPHRPGLHQGDRAQHRLAAQKVTSWSISRA